MRKSRLRSNSVANAQHKLHDRAGLKGTRGFTKKGGGGTSYVWGKPGDELYIPPLKKGDPNYDSENELDEGIILESTSKNNPFTSETLNLKDFTRSHSINGHSSFFPKHHDYSYLNTHSESLKPPKLSLPDFKASVDDAVREFFTSEDFSDFALTVSELDSQILHFELVKRLLTASFSRNERERDLTSKLLCSLSTQQLLTTNQLAKGFERLLENANDLILDAPNAKIYLAQFLAKAVADDLLPPAFLQSEFLYKVAGDIIDHAKTLLTMKHGLARLEHVWKLNFSSPVRELKNEVKMIILEFFETENLSEAAECLKALEVPFFHHEFVKRAVILSMERTSHQQATISLLLKYLVSSEVISRHQLELGLQRLYQELHDIRLDNPDAETVLEIFSVTAVKDGLLTETELKELKIRAEKISKEDREDLELFVAQLVSRPRTKSL